MNIALLSQGLLSRIVVVQRFCTCNQLLPSAKTKQFFWGEGVTEISTADNTNENERYILHLK